MSILIENARIVVGDGSVIERGSVLVVDGRIAGVGDVNVTGAVKTAVDARGRVVMPGFVDAHTHACWAGDRLDEWELKQRGATYLEILESGGGIMSTVRAVRRASEDELAEGLLARLGHMLGEGTTTVEVKSGYGLTTHDEMKMLRAIERAAGEWAGTVCATALIAHAIDSGQEGFVDRTIEETLPAVHEEFPGIPVDAYCEKGAWSLDDTVRLFERAMELGHPVRVHTDQFNELGMTRWAVEHSGGEGARAVSVDHLEATSAENLEAVARSDLFAVMLPCSGFHVDGRYGDGRRYLDARKRGAAAGGGLVIATNCNPGSAPTSSMPMAVALAVRHCGITAAEAVTACTSAAAGLLGLEDRGLLESGRRADVVMLRHTDERMLGYEFGGNPVDLVVCGGRVVE